jgi:hypothetical protein
MLNKVKKVKKTAIILKKSEVEQNVYMENEEENKNEGE